MFTQIKELTLHHESQLPQTPHTFRSKLCTHRRRYGLQTMAFATRKHIRNYLRRRNAGTAILNPVADICDLEAEEERLIKQTLTPHVISNEVRERNLLQAINKLVDCYFP